MNSTVRKALNPITLGYVAFLVQLVFSIVFYLERTCYADVAFQSFTIINTKNVFYQMDRFGAVLIHAFPLAAVLLHLPLKYVLLSYSVAFVAQNLVFYWLLERVLKQKEVALVLALFNVLLVTETFYWTTNEIKQGFSFCILFAGIARAMPVGNYSGIKNYGLMLLHLVLLIITLFLHNLVVFAVVFVLGYGLFSGWKISRKMIGWSFIAGALILLIKYFLLPITGYESEKYKLRENFVTFFPNYFGLPSFRHFMAYCWHDWYLYALMVLAVVTFYVWNKMWLKTSWFLLFTLGYLIMVNVTHPIGVGKPFLESFFQALAIFVLFPFVIDLLPRLNRVTGLAVISIIFILRLNTIFNAHNSYTERLNLIRETISAHEGKFIIPEEYFPAHKLKMPWGIPYESALLTSMMSPDSCRSFAILNDVSQFNAERNNDYRESIYATFGEVGYKQLNPGYFRPAPDTYRILTKEEFFQSAKSIKKP